MGFGALAGNVAVLAGLAGKGGKKERKRILQLWEALQNPEFDMRDLDAPEYQVAGEYLASQAPATILSDPSVPQDSGELRSRQMAALGGLERVAQEGLPLEERLRADELQREVARESQRAQASVLQNLQERGRLGGGDELSARIQGNQQASELARGAGSDLAREAMSRRLGALHSYGDMASGIRGQDFGQQQAQSSVLNRFNEWASNLMTNAAARNAAAQQQAQFANVGQAQQTSDANTSSRYGTALENLNRRNALTQQGYTNELSRLGGLGGALENYALQKDYETAAKAQAFKQIGQGVDDMNPFAQKGGAGGLSALGAFGA